jgi:hypothetical protein
MTSALRPGASGNDSFDGSGGGGGAGIGVSSPRCYRGGNGGSGVVIIDYASPTDLFTTKTGSYSATSYCRSGTKRQVIAWGTGSGSASMPQ